MEEYIWQDRSDKYLVLPKIIASLHPYSAIIAVNSLMGGFPYGELSKADLKQYEYTLPQEESNDIYYGYIEEPHGVNNYRLNAIDNDVNHRVPIVRHPGIPADFMETVMAAGNDIKKFLHQNLQEFAVEQIEQHKKEEPYAQPVQTTFLGSVIEGVVSVEQALGQLWVSSPEFMEDVTDVKSLLLKTIGYATGKHGFVNDFARTLPFASLVTSVYRMHVPNNFGVLTEVDGERFVSLNAQGYSSLKREEGENYWSRHVPCPAVFTPPTEVSENTISRAGQITGFAEAEQIMQEYAQVNMLDFTILALCQQIARRESGYELANEVALAFQERMNNLSAKELCGWKVPAK